MQKIKTCPVCQSSQISALIQTKAQMHPTQETFNFDQCQECQLVFLNPRVDPQNLKAYYTDFYLPYRGAKAWGKYEYLVERDQHKLDEKRARLVQKYHHLHAESLVLDVGCGKPSFLQKCVTKFKCKGLGIDFSDEGWRNDPQAFQGLDLRVGEVKDIDAQLQADVITMWHYLEHDYHPLEHLQELRKHAKEDTTLIIEVPNYASESRKKFGAHWAGWHTPRHLSLFAPHNMELLLQKSGWEVQQILSSGTLDPYVLYWMSRMEQKGIAWDKNMEDEFFGFVMGMIAFMPKKWLQKWTSLGIMTAIAKPAN